MLRLFGATDNFCHRRQYGELMAIVPPSGEKAGNES